MWKSNQIKSKPCHCHIDPATATCSNLQLNFTKMFLRGSYRTALQEGVTMASLADMEHSSLQWNRPPPPPSPPPPPHPHLSQIPGLLGFGRNNKSSISLEVSLKQTGDYNSVLEPGKDCLLLTLIDKKLRTHPREETKNWGREFDELYLTLKDIFRGVKKCLKWLKVMFDLLSLPWMTLLKDGERDCKSCISPKKACTYTTGLQKCLKWEKAIFDLLVVPWTNISQGQR